MVVVSRGLLACLTVIVGALPALAQPGPAIGEDRELVDKVNRSIDRGVQYLKQNQQQGKHWEGLWLNAVGGMDGGVTALATLALLNCGEKPEERHVKAALEYLRGVANINEDIRRTYVVGLTTMVFAEARQPRDLPLIQRNVDWLLKVAARRGGRIIGWSYPVHQGSTRDASNTQYALLGLYAGKQAGAKIPDQVWKDVRQLYLEGEVKSGADMSYWTYSHNTIGEASFTMTAAGVSGLLIAGMGLNISDQQLDPVTGIALKCGQYDENDPIKRGMNWLGNERHFAFEKALNSKSDYYNIYGIERVGRLSGQRFVGRKDWYREGCLFLTRPFNEGGQHPTEGYWPKGNGIPLVDASPVIATSFSLLFLSKGRTPILLSKLAHGPAAMAPNGVMVEQGPANLTGWNRKHNDARHLVEFASRELFNGLPLGWQVYDPRRRELNRDADVAAEVAELVQTPILYFNGHERPKFTGQQKQIIKRYVEEGGFLFVESCCGSPEFTQGFRELVAELFDRTPLRPLPPEHAIWRSFYAVPPTEFRQLEYLDRGCRTVVVFSPEPLAGYYEEARFIPEKGKQDTNRGMLAYRLAGNIIAYATGMEPPKQRLTVAKIANLTKLDQSPPKGYLKPAQLTLGEPPPAQNAMRNLMAHLRSAARIDTVLDKLSIAPGDEELFKYKFMYAHGRKRFDLTSDEVNNLKANLQAGGLLLADACCGKPEFDESFRAVMKKVFPNLPLQPIDPSDDLYSANLNTTAITTVKRREKADGAGPDGGFKDLPPKLEGIKLDGRWVVIYSPYDIGCALENHKASDCRGHDRESALRLATAAVLYALKR